MRRSPLCLAGFLGLLATPGHAQGEHVDAELFLRRVGDELRAAIRVEVERGWHVYDPDIGPLDAPGMPTEVELEGEHVEWGEPLFPEPIQHHVPAIDTWSWVHGGTFEIHLAGRIVGGEPAGVRASISGLVCEDESGVCVLFEHALESSGEGPDEVFAAWDARRAAAGAPGEASPAAAAPDESSIDGGPGAPDEPAAALAPAPDAADSDRDVAAASGAARSGGAGGAPSTSPSTDTDTERGGATKWVLASILVAIAGGVLALRRRSSRSAASTVEPDTGSTR